MCNRFRSIREWSDIPRQYHSGPRLNFEFNPNVAPTELVPVLVAGEGVVLARSGIHRLGSGDKPRPPLLNVRTDGMRKGQFRKHLKERRCVIPCEGFYEWRDEGGKQPYYFSRKDGKPLMLGGIWEISEYKGDSRVAFAILTDEPNELVATIDMKPQPQPSTQEVLAGLIERVTYHNSENGFCVLRARRAGIASGDRGRPCGSHCGRRVDHRGDGSTTAPTVSSSERAFSARRLRLRPTVSRNTSRLE